MTHAFSGSFDDTEGCAKCGCLTCICYRVDDKVMVNGYQGAIAEVCTGQLAGMVIVRLERGQVCVSISEIGTRDDWIYEGDSIEDPPISDCP